MTRIFEWIEDRLEKGAWFRRTYVVVATAMNWRVIEWSFDYAKTSKLSGVEQAAVIGAVVVPAAAVLKYGFDAYMESRK